MKHLAFISCFLFSLNLFAQFTDDFSDGDFTNNPTWTGDVNSFVIDEATGMLRSANTTANARFYLSTANALAIDCQWEFYVNLQFNTSGPNTVNVFLISDNANLSASGINGYFVRMGNAADEICLYKRTNGTDTKIIDGEDGVLNRSNNTLRIRVIRDENHLWKLERDITGSGNSYLTEGTVTDNTFNTSAAFGVFIAQSTASFFGRHFFTDFYVGEIIRDTTPPTVSHISVENNQITILFSEQIADITSDNFSISQGVNNPVSVDLSANKLTATLTFSADFVFNKNYILSINNATDLSGNALEQTQYPFFIPEPPQLPEVGDLLINEIMFDSSTDSEDYIEIYNLSNKNLDLSGLYFARYTDTATQRVNIPAGTMLAPNSYLAFVANAVALREYFAMPEEANITSVTFGTSFLPNTAATFELTNGTIVFDKVSYQAAWHNSTAESTRGISLEKVNPELLVRNPQSWQSATENVNFGTPGYKNSRYQSTETIMPGIFTIELVANNQVQATFSKPISNANFTMPDVNVSITEVKIDDFTFMLHLDKNLIEGTSYPLSINATDFYGNQLQTEHLIFIVEPPEAGDLIFNEIMPNSAADSEDYIEIYNRSNKIIDLTGVDFVRITATTMLTVNIPAGTVIFPHDYLAFASNAEHLRRQFEVPEEANIASVNLGTFLPNSSGTILLTNGAIIFDELTYSDRWHSPLISERRGVALERINPNAPTNDSSNWHSAASNVHWGTPGYKNSQFRDDLPIKTGKRVWAEPENFTPDNDGHNDVTNIFFSTGDIGFFATVFIYDALGRKVRTLANNTLISPEAIIRWDGTDEKGQIVNIGIYAGYAEIIRTDGKKEQFKFPCVVSAVKR